MQSAHFFYCFFVCSKTFFFFLLIGANFVAEELAGSGNPGRLDGRPSECSFNGPYGIVVHVSFNPGN